MLIKKADDKEPQIQALVALLERPDADAALRKRVDLDIKFLRAGVRGEEQAAYEIDFMYGSGQNWAVIHDLRLEHNGRTAQIDHILINRLLECYVLETKSFAEGVSVNEHGEFTQFFGGKPRGIASPIEQNHKHMLVLEDLLSSGRVTLPTRLGVPLKPRCHSFVLVSKTARVSRPKKDLPGVDTILKADQLSTRLNKEFDKVGVGSILKIVAAETLHELGRALAALHVPARVTGPERYGLSSEPLAQAAEAPAAAAIPAHSGHDAANAPAPSQGRTQPDKAACECCQGPVTPAEARYCRLNKTKFDGKVLCKECQKAPAPPPAPAPSAAAPAVSPKPAKGAPPAADSTESGEKAPKYRCAVCEVGVNYAVAKFCWMNKERCGGRILCREHQQKD